MTDSPPVVLFVSGADPSGFSGLAADIETAIHFGIHPAFCISVLTAQNSRGIYEIEQVSENIFKKQLHAISQDLQLRAIKSGLLFSSRIVELTTEFIVESAIENVVIDPVFASSTQSRFISKEVIDLYKTTLLPVASILTPNLPEARELLGYSGPVNTAKDLFHMANDLLGFGPKSILLKGGHDRKIGIDLFVSANADYLELPINWQDSDNLRATGCTLASAIASLLALQYGLTEAIQKARKFVLDGINGSRHWKISAGPSCVSRMIDDHL